MSLGVALVFLICIVVAVRKFRRPALNSRSSPARLLVGEQSLSLPLLTDEDRQWLGVFRETVDASDGRISPYLALLLDGDIEARVCEIFAKVRRDAEEERGRVLRQAISEASSIVSDAGYLIPKRLPAKCVTCGASGVRYDASTEGKTGLWSENVYYECRGRVSWHLSHGSQIDEDCPHSEKSKRSAADLLMLKTHVATTLRGLGLKRDEAERFIVQISPQQWKSRDFWEMFPKDENAKDS